MTTGLTSTRRWVCGNSLTRISVIASTMVLAGAAGSLVCAQDERQVIPSSDDSTRVVKPWAVPGQVRNPVAIAFDWFGNLYVAESDRAGNAVTDTRQLEHLRPTGVEEDLRLRTVEDRRALIQKWLDAGHFKEDYFVEKDDRVRLLRDSDGDGVADESIVYADGFNDAVDGIASGVLWMDGDVYFTNIPHLWKLRDTDGDGVADERESLSYGYGVRWCFYGHDLHGLTAGPDGRIYFSLGDRGYNITTDEGVHLFGPDRGAVFRCWPDGSELELFYDGLRNPQELAFDEYGNFFTGDNNCDSGDRARMIHIVEGGDSGWRQNVQSLPSRGPWNREHIWRLLEQENGPQRPAWTLPPIAHVGAGPSGFSYYPGTGETDAFDDTFLFVDFYGSGATVHHFRMESDGAWFALKDRQDYYKGKTVTDIAWGFDGRLYLSDWGGGWSPNENGNVFTITNETVHADPTHRARIDDVRARFETGFKTLEPAELITLLGHRDQRVRLAAQYELVSQGESVSAALAASAGTAAAPQMQRIHSIWALGQLARSDAHHADGIIALLHDADDMVRVQATKTIADLRLPAPTEYRRLLNDANDQVRFYAALGLGKTNDPGATPLLLNLLVENANEDPMLRHAAIHALTLINQPDELMTAVEFLPSSARLGAVVVLRRLKNIGLTSFLNDADPAVAIEATRAIYDLYLEHGMPGVARLIESTVPEDRRIEPLLRRAIEANVYLGTDECAMRLARFAANESIDASWRMLALERLDQWDKPLMREGVWGDLVELPGRNIEAARHAIVTALPAMTAAATGHEELASRVEALRARFALNLSPDELVAQLGDASRDERYRLVLLEQVQQKAPERLGDACATVIADRGADIAALRMRARELMVSNQDAGALTALEDAVSDASWSLDERQHAVLLLGDADPNGTVVAPLTEQLVAGSLDPAIALEVYTVGSSMEGRSDLLQALSAATEGAEPGSGMHRSLLSSGGNADRGSALFRHHETAQCLRCHTVGDIGGVAGPDLTAVGSRLLGEELIDSLLDPNADVSSGYGAISVRLTSGATVMGTMLASSDAGVAIDVGGETRTIARDDIETQIGPLSAMPAMTSLLTASEIRDVVAYLSSLQDPEFGPARPGKRQMTDQAQTALELVNTLGQIMPEPSNNAIDDPGMGMRWLSLIAFFISLLICTVAWAMGFMQKEA